MSLSNSIYKNSFSFNDLDIVEAALKTGFSDGRRCLFSITDIQRHMLSEQGIKIRSVKWQQKADIIPGAKISVVLRSRGDLFGFVKNGNRVSKFYILADYSEGSE